MSNVNTLTALLLAGAGALAPALAQEYMISTYAGGSPPPTPVAAVNASIGSPQNIATDAAGSVYFASLNCVFKLDHDGVLTRVAGSSRAGFSGDGGPALDAQFFLTARRSGPSPYAGGFSVDYAGGVAVDSMGTLYIADSGNNRIRKVSMGIITTVGGNGTYGYSGDGGPAVNAQLAGLSGLAIDGVGNLYILEAAWNRVRKLSPSGLITTVAGSGRAWPFFGGGFSGDGGPAISAQLQGPSGIAVDSTGNLYIADTSNSRTRPIPVFVRSRQRVRSPRLRARGYQVIPATADRPPAHNCMAHLAWPLTVRATCTSPIMVSTPKGIR